MAGLNQAIRLASRNARVYEIRGVTYGMMGNLSMAAIDFQKGLQLAPGYPNAPDILAWLA